MLKLTLCDALLVTTLIVSLGCDSTPPHSAQPTKTTRGVSNDAGEPVSEAQVDQFAADLLATVYDDAPAKTIEQLVDIDAVLEKSLEGLDVSDGFRQGFRDGATTALLRDGIVKQLRVLVGNGGSYEFLRQYKTDGARHVVIRLLHPGGEGVNYHDFRLGLDAQGNPVAKDLYIFMSGENISESMRRFAMQGAAQENRSILSRIRGEDVAFIESLEQIGKISQALQRGNGLQGLRIYGTLPEEVRDMKSVLLLRVQAAGLLPEDLGGEYEAALKRFRELFPDDAAVDFLSIDYYLLTGDFEKCMAAVSRVHDTVKDPYLHVLTASALSEAGDSEGAALAVEKAIREEPTLELAHATGLALALEADDHKRTAGYLASLADDFGYVWNDLTEAEEYQAFVASPEYETFKAEYQIQDPAN